MPTHTAPVFATVASSMVTTWKKSVVWVGATTGAATTLNGEVVVKPLAHSELSLATSAFN